MKIFPVILMSALVSTSINAEKSAAKNFELQRGEPVKIYLAEAEKPVVQSALQLLARDFTAVLDAELQPSAEAEADIIAATIGQNIDPKIDLNFLNDKKQAFVLTVLPNGKLFIVGSDSHGTAYGLMQLSRLLGVSPWEWWADVLPDRLPKFQLAVGYRDEQCPSVEYRGIFINDEDWGLMPWSSLNYEPAGKKGRIGPRTNERIFELLLRLRANTFWPAMHECTEPFFLTDGNREAAEKFGIYIGGSHCEPMASSTAGEWQRRGVGEYDYVNNSEAVRQFWASRLKEVAGQEIIYTLGMRGVHDGAMRGAKTLAEQKAVLGRVIADQRAMLAQFVNTDTANIPQVFIPYKEVLDVYRYDGGLQVPEDVTLMWCDDNYGYIRHFPDSAERARKGGNGIYYHVSYWGRPHDYLWLGTFSPALMFRQMNLAFDQGIQKMWVLNVGDIKPIEYQIELFMDMAWNIEAVRKQGTAAHMHQFLVREIGRKAADKVLPAMQEHYRLAFIRKPEHMGNTRVEEADKKRYSTITDLPWSETVLRQRLADYKTIAETVTEAASLVPENRRDAYFQLVEYPVRAAAAMNEKFIFAQLARHGKADWKASDAAYDTIVALTARYNNAKWNYIMDHRPRKLPVFDRVPHVAAAQPLPDEPKPLKKWNATEHVSASGLGPCDGLGHEGKAAAIAKGGFASFDIGACKADTIIIEVRLLPSHPVEGKLRFSIGIDDLQPVVVDYATKGRSEEWKQNVLRNQAVRRVALPLGDAKRHTLTICAQDGGVVLDQILIFD